MRKFDAIRMGFKTFIYDGIIYQTDRMKILLCFYNGSEAWQGMYPGCSFDHYYDDIMPKLGPDCIDPYILNQRQTIPTMIYPFKNIGICQKPQCSNRVDYKYCSLMCWLTNSVDINQYTINNAENSIERENALNFRRKLTSQYGCFSA